MIQVLRFRGTIGEFRAFLHGHKAALMGKVTRSEQAA